MRKRSDSQRLRPSCRRHRVLAAIHGFGYLDLADHSAYTDVFPLATASNRISIAFQCPFTASDAVHIAPWRFLTLAFALSFPSTVVDRIRIAPQFPLAVSGAHNGTRRGHG